MNSGEPAEAHPRTTAETRHTRWPGWIWAVPIAAAGVGCWLGIRALVDRGESVTVTFDQGFGLQPNESDVTLHGVKVGKVSEVTLSSDARRVAVSLKLGPGMAKFLRRGTRFWIVGGRPSLANLASLKFVLAGPEIAMEPGPGARTDHFSGLDGPPKDMRQAPPDKPTYWLHFAGSAGELSPGTPVTLRGFSVGTVRSARLSYDFASDRLSEPVEITLDPQRLHYLGVPRPIAANERAVLDAMLRRLVARGLRAEIVKNPPIIGASSVELTILAGAAPAPADAGAVTIPTVASGGGIDAIASRASAFVSKLDQLPIEQIGQHLRDAIQHIDSLASSPQLRASEMHLNRTLTELDRTIHEAAPQITPTVASLRKAAAAADQAAQAARGVVAGNPATQDGDLPSALREITDAARSIRALAAYLERHPEAIIKGKPGDRR